MNLPSLIIYFITGSLFTAIVVTLEQNGQRILSGLATLIPVFTLVAYFFIGQNAGTNAVSQHAKCVLAGTLVSWGALHACDCVTRVVNNLRDVITQRCSHLTTKIMFFLQILFTLNLTLRVAFLENIEAG